MMKIVMASVMMPRVARGCRMMPSGWADSAESAHAATSGAPPSPEAIRCMSTKAAMCTMIRMRAVRGGQRNEDPTELDSVQVSCE